MSWESPWSTPASTPLRVRVVESSTPRPKPTSPQDITIDWHDLELSSPSATTRSRERANSRHRIQMRRLRNLLMLLCLPVMLVVILRGRMSRVVRSTQSEQKMGTSHKKVSFEGLQFIEADHPYIRYAGRWTADHSRMDASFPGAYFDFAVNGSKTVLLALNIEDQSSLSPATSSKKTEPLTNQSQSGPISLLLRVDDDEYYVLPNASGVSVLSTNLALNSNHQIRIIAPMVGGDVVQTLQVEGILIDSDGQLHPLDANVGISYNDPTLEQNSIPVNSMPRRMLEIVTDLPGLTARKAKNKSTGTFRSILGGVLGWEYLLGEMFGSDHVTVGMDGMCLIQDCIGGRASPSGLADVFFQSGPVGSRGFELPWPFEAYIPDVMVMNIGHADWESFTSNSDGYNKTMFELSLEFEDTYISMIKAIRTLGYATSSKPFPIFVMRPFRGQLAEATHSIADRLRSEGDRAVFWLDTSGWLNTEVDFVGRAEDKDFFLDEESPLKPWRLTERGNQRVAILLHSHVCRYLAQNADRCVFLPPEAYEGKLAAADEGYIDDSVGGLM